MKRRNRRQSADFNHDDREGVEGSDTLHNIHIYLGQTNSIGSRFGGVTLIVPTLPRLFA